MGLAEDTIQLFREYESALSPLRNRQKKWDSFYRGRQYTRKEKKDLQLVGLYPLVVNIEKPLIHQRRAILTSSKPSWNVVPLQSGSKLVASALRQFLVAKWNSDYLDTQLNKALKDMLIAFVGYLHIDLASFLDNSIFDVNCKHLSWRYVFPDPDSEQFDLSDAENIFVRKNISLGRAMVVFRMTEQEAKASLDYEYSHTHGELTDRRVDVLDRYSKFPVHKNVVTPKEGQHLRNLPTVFYTSNVATKLEADRRKLLDEMKSLAKEGKIELKGLKELHVRKVTLVGSLEKYSGLLNIRDYPVIPFMNDEGPRFVDGMSDVGFTEGLQKVTNKFYLLTMHNAMLTGNVRVMGPEDAVKDKTKFERSASRPGVYLGYEPNPALPDGGRPMILQPGSLPGAFYSLSQDLIEKSKFILNVYGPVLGDPKASPETFSTTATLQEFGTQPIKELARRVDLQIAKAGEVMIQYIQNYAPRDEMLQFLDLQGEITPPRDPQTNEPVVLNQVVIEDGIVKEIKNNTRIGQFAVKVLTQPNLGTDRLAKAAFIRDMVMNKAIPGSPAIIGLLLDLMEVPKAATIMEELSQSQSTAMQIQQLEEVNALLNKQLDLHRSEVDRLMKRVEITEFKADLDKLLNDVKFKGKEAVVNLKRRVEELEIPTNGGETQ